ncbi:MAG TPA: regulatory protein RecX [Parachlamydiaceae bacterium]|nr:regulatory protein RecX [Parachlamydiaceae bacterium]
MMEAERKKAKAYLYKKLAQKNYCSLELKKKMQDELFSKDLIEELIKECEGLGYINDEEWLNSFIRGAKAKSQGPLFIIQKLIAKGFCKEMIKRALGREDSKEERKARIVRLLATRYKSRELKDFKERQKVVASLVRKGFSYEEVLEEITLKIKA